MTKQYFSFIGIDHKYFYNYLTLFLIERCIEEINKLENIEFNELSNFGKNILECSCAHPRTGKSWNRR